MSFFYPSISFEDLTEPFELQVARGQVPGHRVVHVFGYNPDIDSGVEETVWTYGGIYSHLAAPSILTVSSGSTDDAAAGTGARTVFIEGISGTGAEVSESVTLNGQTAVSTTHAYTEINFVTVTSAGSGGANAGAIYVGYGTVTLGVPAQVYGHILAGYNRSLTGHYQVPSGHTGFIVRGSISSGTENNSGYVLGKLVLRDPVSNLNLVSAAVTFSTSKVDFEFPYAIKVPAGACVTARALTNKNDDQVSSYFQIVLIEGAPQPGPGTPRI
jgi:hypothetical protein